MNSPTLGSDLIELLAVFFTNRICIGVHKSAVSAFRDNKYASLPDAFRDGLGIYRNALGNAPKHMSETIQELYEFSKKFLELDCTLMGYIDVCARHILPPDQYRLETTTHEKKIAVFRSVLIRSLTRFINQLMGKVEALIKDTEDLAAMEKYKLELVKIYQAERTQFYSCLVASANGINPQNEGGGVSRELVEKLQEEIRGLLREKVELQSRCNQLTQYALAVKAILLEKEQIIAEMSKNQKLQRQVQRGGRSQYQPMQTGMVPPMMQNMVQGQAQTMSQAQAQMGQGMMQGQTMGQVTQGQAPQVQQAQHASHTSQTPHQAQGSQTSRPVLRTQTSAPKVPEVARSHSTPPPVPQFEDEEAEVAEIDDFGEDLIPDE